MALTLGDNFSYQGAKPLDARLVYSTVASMKAVADSTMYDGCLAYCTATDKTYQWKSTNAVDETTGKWREFTSGGGSSVVSGYYKEADHLFYEESTYTTPIAGAANTIYISVDTNKSYRYNSSIFVRIDEEEGQVVQIATLPTASASNLGKIYEYVGATTQDYTNGVFYQCVFDGTSTYSWEVCDVVDTLSASDVTDVKNAFNVPPSAYGGGGEIIIDDRGTERAVGKYIDAQGNVKTLYQKTIASTLTGDSSSVAHGISNLDVVIHLFGTIVNGNSYIQAGFYNGSTRFSVGTTPTELIIREYGINLGSPFKVTIQYTKTV